MEIRKRTSKSVAGRHDLNYFKKGSPLRRWQGQLTLAALACTAVWLAASALWHGPEMLSSGPISSSHAVFGAKCAACHKPVAGNLFHRAGFRRDVPDRACLACHAIPAHHANQRVTPKCSGCHVEHTGSMMLAHTADGNCTACHANLTAVNAETHFAATIHSFVEGHPDFAPLRAGFADDNGIKFAHAAHMKKGLLGPHGPVQMACADCHRVAAEQADAWLYGATMQTAAFSLTGGRTLGTTDVQILDRDRGRAYVAPVTYATGCHDCHTLKFDSHIGEEAPHADPAQVRAFVAAKIRAFAAQHPEVVAAELRHWTAEPMGRVPRQTLTAVPHNAAEWVTVRTAEAERRLWHESCGLCHAGPIPEIGANATVAELAVAIENPAMLPKLVPTRQPVRWLSHAVFSHEAHQAVACAECHTRATASQNANEVLLPSIATCRRCHDGESHPQGPALANGHAESGCFLCHEYHAWDEKGLRLQPVKAESLRELGVMVPR
ncbi:MAG TPA: cytochrome c3 family protein [Acidobacteriaceae bacterium]|nr:cytochrome c3 family protein [Acidobacteriaceae bacterium]